MALRSGYKGIKKLAAGLKWNRPGILAADDTALAKVFFPRSEQAELGAKNIAPIIAKNVTNKGITLTFNEDDSVVVSGTATEAVGFEISSRGKWLKNGVSYKLSGCKGGSQNTYKLDCVYTTSGWLAVNTDEDEVIFTANNTENYVIRIVVYANVTMDNVLIKPMIRLATDTDPTFAPPAMTNKELTDLLTITEGEFINIVEGATVTAGLGNKITKFGKVVVAQLSLTSVTIAAWNNICQVPTAFRPKSNIKVKDLATSIIYNVERSSNIANIMPNDEISSGNINLVATWITE